MDIYVSMTLENPNYARMPRQQHLCLRSFMTRAVGVMALTLSFSSKLYKQCFGNNTWAIPLH
jgi:hypothetical protein